MRTSGKTSLTLHACGASTAWDAAKLTGALRKAGFRYARGRDTVGAAELRDGCEAFLDKETDVSVIRLYEIADIAANRDAAATVRVAA